MPSLEYQISANLGRGGGYIAWRDREPVFCVLAKDQATASQLADHVIRDYVERFAWPRLRAALAESKTLPAMSED